MTIFDSVLIGIVEGLTEFLPISSTAHLAMTARVLGLAQTEFVKTFEIAIQLGAILAVVVVYWKRIVTQQALVRKVIAAFIPTGIIGLVLYKLVKDVFLESYPIMVASLVIGGVVIILFERYRKSASYPNDTKPIEAISYYDALRIGIFQSIAIIPGVSRAGATIIGGLFIGLEKKAIVEFSFLLAIPTMLAATLYDIYKNAGQFSHAEIQPLVIGFIVAFISALIAIRFLVSYISRHNFTAFGIYRILVGVLFFLVFLI